MKTRSGSRRVWMRRALSLLLAAVMMLGYLPSFPGAENSEAEAHWADPYLSQLVEWGFIRADQANNPNLALTRADFMAIVNRAYGYDTPGETPFEDVAENKWYYDDVGIAYTAKYIQGTSPTTASPESALTRETATTILGRNMMLQESPGEILDFTDARQISNWAMGTVKSSLEHYLVSGYDDGTFRPKRNVSWGEMATMVTRLIGTPLQEAGDYALGGVFGNVTITADNVALRDTVASGDVYITGGVGLGGIVMENVDVLGRIIASGTGRSEAGNASILLRNVTADEMLIDNLQDNYVSVQADGVTEIGRTVVRTSAYIEDNTPDGMGLKYISIEGDSYPEGEEPEGWEPIQVDLAGRIGEVVNRTPRSQIRVAKGTVEKLTIDEAATDSTVIIDRGAVVKELNLDTATYVTGEGDIEHLVVNAPGCVIDIMPDTITIRPGITAIICGEEMDSVAAEEFSMEPLILAGYPEARDITPTGLEGVFMTNKAGTIYWAVSAITDGSVGEDDLIKPPSYGSIAVRNGTVKVSKGNEEVVAAIGGLTPGGSYYLSAVLEDAKGNRSPVKVISFTTPDNTVPAFCEGYPHMSKVSPKDSVVVTMTNKDCKLYYALLPVGAMAPTENEMRTNAVAGALGYGVRDAYKNIEDVFRVNDQLLEEQTTYVLYFFLTDADGVNKSGIISITFTTDDETPPEFIIEPTVNKVEATSVGLTFRLNENGTVYWVAIPANTTNYPKPEPGTDYPFAPPNSMYGKLQIANGMNIGADGKAGKVTAVENVDGTITVSGLKPETAYDFYYVAKDNAGPDRNYSEVWKKITINTLDTNGPKFFQSFSDSSSLDGKSDPRSNTAIYLDVSENVRYTGEGGGTSFMELYQAVKDAKSETERNTAKNKLAANLYGAIKLHKINLSDNSEETITSRWQTSQTESNWTIDYTQATVEAHEGMVRITFPRSALHLENGGMYYFTITNITDTSTNQNALVPSTVDFYTNEVLSRSAGHDVPVFIVEFARVDFSIPGVGAGSAPIVRGNEGMDDDEEGKFVRVDMSFRMTPISTDTVADQISYDLLLWTNKNVAFDLYYRVVDPRGGLILQNGAYPNPYTSKDPNTEETITASDYLMPRRGGRDNTPDANGWIYLGDSNGIVNAIPDDDTPAGRRGRSVNKAFNGCDAITFPQLNKLNPNLRYEFVIHLTEWDDTPEIDANGNETWRNWNGEVKFFANVAAGQSSNLDDLGMSMTPTNWETKKQKGLNGGVVSIGRNNTREEPLDTQELSRMFTDSRLPRFESVTFVPGSNSVVANLFFSTSGTLYYLVGKAATDDRGIPEINTTRTLLTAINGNTNPEGEKEDSANPGRDPNDDPNKNLLEVNGNPGAYYIRLTDVATNGTPLAPTENGSTMQKWMIGGIKENPALTAEQDDPEKENLILTPKNQYVFNPKGQTDTANAISGNFPFKGRVLEPLTVEGLQPETDYFIYFVIKGENDTLSHVYIYHFKTDTARKPKISIETYTDPKNKNAGGASLKTDIDSKMQYLVYTRTDAETKIPLLNGALGMITVPNVYYQRSQNKDDMTPKLTGEVDANGNPVQATDESGNPLWEMTPLKAIVSLYNGESAPENTTPAGFSAFDAYADNDMKQRMSEFLHGNYTSAGIRDDLRPVNSGSREFDLKGEVWKNDTLDIALGTDYVVLAVARVPDSDKDDPTVMSFYGKLPLRLGSQLPPEVINWNMNLQMGKRTDDEFPGTITIIFDRQLYAPPDGTTVLNSGNILTSGFLTGWDLGGRVVPTVSSTANSTTIIFTGRWSRGDQIMIMGDNVIGAGNVRNGSKMLLIEVDEADDHSGMYGTIEWGASGATPTFAAKSKIFPFKDSSANVSVDFMLTKGITPPDDVVMKGTMGNRVLYIPAGTTAPINITGTVQPDEIDCTYFWSSSKENVARVTKIADGSKPGTHTNATATITAGEIGESTITLRVVDGSGNTTPFTFTVVVYGLKLSGATGAGSINTAGGLVLDLSKWQDGTKLTFTSNAPLGDDINISSGTTTISRNDLFTINGAVEIKENRTVIEVALTVKPGGDAASGSVVPVTITFGNGKIKCDFTVTFTGSASGVVPAPTP